MSTDDPQPTQGTPKKKKKKGKSVGRFLPDFFFFFLVFFFGFFGTPCVTYRYRMAHGAGHLGHPGHRAWWRGARLLLL
jgi:hypothetical protein